MITRLLLNAGERVRAPTSTDISDARRQVTRHLPTGVPIAERSLPIFDRLLFPLTLVAALGCGLVAGVLFAFSVFVMPALHRLPPAQGIAAMQSINVAAITPLFMLALFGTAAGCVALTISSLVRWHEPGAWYLLIGSVLYLVGTMIVTIAFNVPRNDALAAVAPDSAAGASLWAGYITGWTAWNHVRTIAALAAAASLTLALWRQSR